MVRWHQQLNGDQFEQAQGDSEGQGSLVCCSSWGHKELDMTSQLNNNKIELTQKAEENLTVFHRVFLC